MISPTDKKNIVRLQELRSHKINKTLISIEREKRLMTEAVESFDQLKKELEQFNLDRNAAHKSLFNGLQQQKSISINMLTQYRSTNQQLVDEEYEIFNQISSVEKTILEKESEIELHRVTLHKLNKKIESLNQFMI